MLFPIFKKLKSRFVSQISDKRIEIIVITVLFAISIGMYLKLGRVDLINLPTTTQEDIAITEESHSTSAPDITSLLESLEDKLEQNPNDGNGWALLARSYVEIGRHAESFSSFEKAINLIPNNPQLLADYADTIAVVNGHDFNGKPENLIKKLLAIDPNHEKGLLLAATSAFNNTDYKQAISIWSHLLTVLPVGSTLSDEVNASIAEANQLVANTSAIKPIQKQLENNGLAVEISGVIKLAPNLVNKVSPNETLFIFAKEVNGSPMPLAAIKTNTSKIPYIYHLNDSHALNPNVKLSLAKEVTIVARISKDGDASAKPGDLQGMSGVIKVGDVLQDIEINQIITF